MSIEILELTRTLERELIAMTEKYESYCRKCNEPEKPRCVLCNHQVDIYIDTKLCEVCDSSQKMKDIPFPDMSNHDEEVCDALASDVEGYKNMIISLRKCLAKEKKTRRKEVRSLHKSNLKNKKERDEANLAFKILGDKYDQLIKEIKAKSK